VDLAHSLDRWLYRGNRPHRVAQALNGAWATLAGMGLGPRRLVRMEVRGRRSGRTISLPLVVADLEGERYLVSMLGDRSGWVRNARAAGGRVVLRHGDREEVRLEDVAQDKRGAVLRRYLECAPGARAHIPIDRNASIEALDEAAASIPIFRIRPLASGPTAAEEKRAS